MTGYVYGIDCQQHKHKCNDDVWRSVMSAACPHTCGLCHHGECRDQIDGCCAMKHLCRDYAYRSYLTLNCGKTCEACGNAKTSASTRPDPLKGKGFETGSAVRVIGQVI
ncbi:Protein F35E8.7 [Aphelenchoides avenae]|nr:Protein F35E8.7 [Aphelenchus avenae]